jgi:hypothetical protein
LDLAVPTCVETRRPPLSGAGRPVDGVRDEQQRPGVRSPGPAHAARLRDRRERGRAAQPQQAAPAKTLDRFTPSDRTAAANPVDSLRVAALRRDALAPGIDATGRASSERPTVAPRRAG